MGHCYKTKSIWKNHPDRWFVYLDGRLRIAINGPSPSGKVMQVYLVRAPLPFFVAPYFCGPSIVRNGENTRQNAFRKRQIGQSGSLRFALFLCLFFFLKGEVGRKFRIGNSKEVMKLLIGPGLIGARPMTTEWWGHMPLSGLAMGSVKRVTPLTTDCGMLGWVNLCWQFWSDKHPFR